MYTRVRCRITLGQCRGRNKTIRSSHHSVDPEPIRQTKAKILLITGGRVLVLYIVQYVTVSPQLPRSWTESGEKRPTARVLPDFRPIQLQCIL